MSSAELISWVPGDAKSVSRLAHSGIAEEDFYREFLNLLPTAPCVMGMVAWNCAAESFSQLVSSTQSGQVELGISPGDHAAQLHQVRVGRKPQSFRPDDTYGHSPTIVVLPIIDGNEVPIVIAVCLADGVSDVSVAEFIGGSKPLCDVAANFYSASSPIVSQRSLGLTPAVHQSLSVERTCYSVANEGRRAVDCDRVSVLTRCGDKFKVRAVSGQESVQSRANVIRFLEVLVSKALCTGEVFWYPDQANQLPPEIEQELERYLEVALSRRLGILPLAVEDQDETPVDPQATKKLNKLVGAVVLEQFTDKSSDEQRLRQRSHVLVEEASVALNNAVDHEEIFLLPVWRKLGALRHLFRGNMRWKTAAVATACLLVVAALVLIPAELKVVTDGRLMPSVRHNLFAQYEGTIVELSTTHGAQVHTGNVLAKLRNHEVDLARQQARGEIRKVQARIDAIRARRFSHDPAEARTTEVNAAAAEEENLRELLKSLKQQMEILDRRQQQLSVVSPIDGQVITWNLEKRLMDRPVERGQMLMEVADLAGPWRLELNLPDRRICEFLEASEADAALEVIYVLASDTSKKFKGHVSDVARATRVDSENGQHVLVHVDIDQATIPLLQPGTGIQAKIHCGRRSLGYVWLRDVWHFLNSKVFFRLT